MFISHLNFSLVLVIQKKSPSYEYKLAELPHAACVQKLIHRWMEPR